MKSGPLELRPAREFAQRMHELEAELQRARQAQRRLKADPDGGASRWGLETRPAVQQEEGWFLTYLDMMTLLLVVMIVMLAFAGGAMRSGQDGAAKAMSPAAAQAATDTDAPPLAFGPHDAPASEAAGDIPAPDAAFPYPAAPDAAFEQSAYPSPAQAAMASAYPTPMDLAPEPAAEPSPATPATSPAPSAAATPQSAPASPSVAAPQAVPATPSSAPPVATAPQADAGTGTGTASAAPPSAASTPDDPAPAPAVTQAAGTPSPSAATPSAPPATEPANAHSEGQSLAAALPLDELGSEVEVIVNKRSVSLRVNSEILFGTGQADLSPHGLAVLKRMAEVLSKDGYDIMVEGHTDSVPVRNNGRYPSNWELSSARAGSVVRYLQANGISKAHLKAVGYADTRPIAGNQDAEGRARNRRVELVIEKPDRDAGQAPDNTPAATPQR